MPNKQNPTQKFIDVEDIKNEVVYLKDGSVRKILIVNGINFDLKSQREQELILNNFQSFLNDLDFRVQFFIHSRKVNIKNYIEKVKKREKEEENELLKTQISEYVEFVSSFVENNPIINKNFFLVVSYDSGMDVEDVKSGILGFFQSNKSNNNDDESMEEMIQQLNYRVDQVISGLERIGLRVRTLEDDELTELFYNLYNPELIEKKGEEIPYTSNRK
ncbi:MAG: TraC family protein [Candidatus Magasanikbacteria bacterium]